MESGAFRNSGLLECIDALFLSLSDTKTASGRTGKSDLARIKSGLGPGDLPERTPPFPRFRALALLGRLPSQRVAFIIQASEKPAQLRTLHHPKGTHGFLHAGPLDFRSTGDPSMQRRLAAVLIADVVAMVA